MLKKYHVGEFIKQYMDALDITESNLVVLTGLSQKHINNIILGKNVLTINIAIKLSIFLKVEPNFLMGLQNKHLEYVKNKENLLNVQSELMKLKIKPYIINNFIPNLDNFLTFKTNPLKYERANGIVHYEPSSSNLFKKWFMIEMLNKIAKYDKPLDKEGSKNYVEHDLKNELNKVNNSISAINFLEITQKNLRDFGVNIVFTKTGLNTTIKGIGKIRDIGANILIEFSENFANMTWYLIHELSHIISEKNADEDHINLISEIITSGTFKNQFLVAEGIAEKIFTLLNDNPTKPNAYLYYEHWKYKSNNHHMNKHVLKIRKEDMHDLFYLFI